MLKLYLIYSTDESWYVREQHVGASMSYHAGKKLLIKVQYVSDHLNNSP